MLDTNGTMLGNCFDKLEIAPMCSKLIPRTIVPLFFLVLVLFPYVVMLGEDRVFVRATNQTQHYLHIIINGTPFLYVSAGRTVFLEAEGGNDILMEAFYAPGQQITGRVEQSVHVPTYQVDCSSGGCEEGVGSSSNNPFVWDITPDVFQTGLEN